MLYSINNNLSDYAKLIIETIEDGEVDDEEKKRIKTLENKLMSDAHQVTKGDNNISDDERTMLDQLIATIQSI